MSSVVREDTLVSVIRHLKEITPKRNFKQSVELIVALRDWDVRKVENRFWDVVALPNKPTKNIPVCVIADGEMANKAREVADLVLTREDVESLGKNKRNVKKIARKYYWFLVKADLMPIVGRILGPALGPRAKRPIPISHTVDIVKEVEKYKSSVRIYVKDQPQVMCMIGAEDMDEKALAENALAVLAAVENHVKDPYHIGRIYVKMSMGPALPVPKG